MTSPENPEDQPELPDVRFNYLPHCMNLLKYYWGLREVHELGGMDGLVTALLRREGVVPTDDDRRNYAVGLMQAEDSPDADKEIQEFFGMVPLRFVATKIEMNRTIDEMFDWYHLSTGMLIRTAERHNQDVCLHDEQSYGHLACDKSQTCPLKVARKELIEPIARNDYDNIPQYHVDPEHYLELTRFRAVLAAEYDLVSDEAVLDLVRDREADYNRYLLQKMRKNRGDFDK